MKKTLSQVLALITGSMLTIPVFSQILPSIVPPSPQSTNFTKFGDFPVDYNTGIPDISIPLYTIKSGDIEIPITLRYYSIGIKPKEYDGSNIGAGWTLETGGLISREVKGRADEMIQRPSPFQFAGFIDQNSDAGCSYLADAIQRNKDFEHDKFSYSFLGHSGNFAINDDGTGHFIAYPYPFSPYKFDVQTGPPISSSYYKSITGIDITDDNGMKFLFGHSNTEYAGNDFDQATTGWYLENISNPMTGNNVQFSYTDIPEFYYGKLWHSTVLSPGDNGVNLSNYPNCDNAQYQTPYGDCVINGAQLSYRTKNISAIYFANGRIQFTLSSDNKLIQSFTVFNSNNTALKTIVFNTDLFPGSTKFNRLNSIEIKDSTGATTEKYGFTYDLSLSATDDHCSIDYWGYCNGTTNTFNCAARQTMAISSQNLSGSIAFIPINIGNTDFTPMPDYAKRFILKTIQYPTGGTTDFIFEGNSYRDPYTQNLERPGGGLRIKQIISRPSTSGDAVIKTYEYEPGFIPYSMADERNFVTTTYQVVPQCSPDDVHPTYYSYRNRVFSNSWNENLEDNRVSYNKITEYEGVASYPLLAPRLPSPANSGKTVYTYSYDNPDGAGGDPAYVSSYRNWGNGLLVMKESFSRTDATYPNSGFFTKKEDISYTYEFKDKQTLNDLFVSMNCYYDGGNEPISINTVRHDIAAGLSTYLSNLPPPCNVGDVMITTGAYYLKSTLEHEYSGDQTMTVSTVYDHNDTLNYYVTGKTVTLSDGSTKKTTYTYPQELSDAMSQSMVSNNLISPAIQTSEFRNNNLTQVTKTNYRNWGNNLLAPETIEIQDHNHPSEVRLRYFGYDANGNVLSVAKENDIHNSYIWDYNGKYPVAEVKNASPQDIAYTSFEANGGGNWAIPSSFRYNSGLTGSLAYNLGNGNISSVNTLNTAQTYVVTYWSASGPYLVNGAAPVVTGRTVSINGNNWTNYEHHLTGSASITVSGGGLIDELRLYPANAQMTSYTYQPLVGTTSACDIANRVTYYTYDKSARLQIIKDQDGNILKTIDYHIQGQ